MAKKYWILFVSFLLWSSIHAQDTLITPTYKRIFKSFWDTSINREIPVAIYLPQAISKGKYPLAILNHGYNANEGQPYLGYSFIAEALVEQGYAVVCIQHELPTDSLLRLGEPIVANRRSSWIRGIENIRVVLYQLKLEYFQVDYNRVTLIGHSHGGDMVAMYPTFYPEGIEKIITLDNRRVALPRNSNLPVLSLRSSDQPADQGVLPTPEEIAQFPISIFYVSAIHNHMNDEASSEERDEMLKYILDFLR